MKKKPKILVMCDYYLPGFRGGGPIRSVSNLLEALKGDFDFKVVTRDRDLTSAAPYRGVALNRWNRVGAAEVLYLSPKNLRSRGLARHLNRIDYDLLYLNGFFTFRFSILPLLLLRSGAVARKPVILAPRGEFSPGALGIKAYKKRLFLAAARAAGLYRGLTWQASGEGERKDIKREWGGRARTVIAPNLVRAGRENQERPFREKKPGTLRIVYFSRITPKKNLDFALHTLHDLPGAVTFDIGGPRDDRRYWTRCRETISSLPSNIKVVYHGDIAPKHGAERLKDSHLFYLPTRGENFGHAIWEALLAGCPVLISDCTPWRNLEDRSVGWDLPLEEPEAFKRVLHRMVEMDEGEFNRLSRRAREFALQIGSESSAVEKNRELFIAALKL